MAKKIADVPARLYATPNYLSSLGYPKDLGDFKNATFINMSNSDTFLELLNDQGFELSKANFPIITEDFLVLWEFVKQGLGVGILDEIIGDKEPLVQRAVPDLKPLTFPIWLVAHSAVSIRERCTATQVEEQRVERRPRRRHPGEGYRQQWETRRLISSAYTTGPLDSSAAVSSVS